MLRKGPDSVPNSLSVLAFAIGLLLFSFFCSATLTPATGNDDLGVSFLTAIMSYVVYWLVLVSTGHSNRLLPTISSIMACGSLLSVARVVVYVVLTPILSVNMTMIVVELIVIWSIPVKGHIIARAIGQHWYVGIAIAMIIFIMRGFVYFAMTNSVSS